MKASLKLRDDRKPLFRAKVPISVAGLPFQSGLVAGESKELSLNIATFFESGPSIKASYRPNDPWNSFSLLIKSGTGPLGSPISSPMIMSAEFNLLGNSSPSFLIHFKPRFGDFSLKKSHSSKSFPVGRTGSLSDDDSSIEVVDFQGEKPGIDARRTTMIPPQAARVAGSMLSGIDLAARTTLPVSRAALKFRWGVRVPGACVGSNGVDLRKMPFLVMDKMGVEWVPVGGKEPSADAAAKGNAYEALRREVEGMKSNSGMMMNAIEELRREVSLKRYAAQEAPFGAGGERNSGRFRAPERPGSKKETGPKIERKGEEKRPSEEHLSEELKRALQGAVNANKT